MIVEATFRVAHRADLGVFVSRRGRFNWAVSFVHGHSGLLIGAFWTRAGADRYAQRWRDFLGSWDAREQAAMEYREAAAKMAAAGVFYSPC